MIRQQIVEQIAQAYQKLGIPFTREQNADVEIHAEFLNAGWSIGRKKFVCDASVLASEEDQTVYLWQKTTESGGGLSFGSELETSVQTGATLFRKVRLVQYGPEGKTAELNVNLGEIARIAETAAKQNGWKFHTVLRQEKARYKKDP